MPYKLDFTARMISLDVGGVPQSQRRAGTHRGQPVMPAMEPVLVWRGKIQAEIQHLVNEWSYELADILGSEAVGFRPLALEVVFRVPARRQQKTMKLIELVQPVIDALMGADRDGKRPNSFSKSVALVRTEQLLTDMSLRLEQVSDRTAGVSIVLRAVGPEPNSPFENG